MAIGDDFSINAAGDIRYIGSPNDTFYTVIEFHRWLGDLQDDAQAAGNDILDITSATASQRSTDNIITLNSPYNIDDATAQQLYDGSIIQNNGDDIYDGLLVLANAGMYLEIIQNGSLVTPNFWTTGLNPDADQGISHRFMLKVRSGGVDIDGRRVVGTTREFGFTYSEWRINGTVRGNNVMALSYTNDLNNETAEGTVSGWGDMVNVTEGYVELDVDNDSVNEPYYSEWDRGSRSINQFYERMKWLTRRGSTSTLYGLNGQLFRGITHQVPISHQSGTFEATAFIQWPTGTGQMLAINESGASSPGPSKMWIQVLTGVAPSSGHTISVADSPDASALVTATPTVRTISAPFIGQSTGTAIIGAYGVGLQEADLASTDSLTDLDAAPVTPPNNVTFTVSGLIAGEDYVLVGPASGGSLNTSQFELATGLNGVGETAVVVNTAIPTDTPSSGTIRIELNSGIYRRVAYTSYSGATFTIGSTDFSSDPADGSPTTNNVFISYIDTLAVGSPTGDPSSASFTSVYLADRSLFIRVRDGASTPIKTFESTGTLGSTGGSSTAIRTTDE